MLLSRFGTYGQCGRYPEKPQRQSKVDFSVSAESEEEMQ
jgi:hypothetical protein